jgi:hypothetical protein
MKTQPTTYKSPETFDLLGTIEEFAMRGSMVGAVLFACAMPWPALGQEIPHSTLKQDRSVADADSFYMRRQEIKGIEIKAPISVHPDALKAAGQVVAKMLANRSDIADRMKERKAGLAIIPHDRFITALPEFARLSNKNDPNGNPYDSFKVRGAGGVPGQPVTATSEENLLRSNKDPFAAENITVHEFAHGIMNLGFTDDERRQWLGIYDRAKQRKLFPGAFAMTNPDEYWAELSQSYFGVNNEINGPLIISQRDPEAFRFLEGVYGRHGSIGTKKK